MSTTLTQPELSLQLLNQWVDLGWLRPLDKAFADFLWQLDPSVSGLTLIASALVSFQVSRGHICLDLAGTLDNPNFALALEEHPYSASPEHKQLLPNLQLQGISLIELQHCLRQSSCVSSATQATAEHKPLVLAGSFLYLRRYWDYEQSVIRHLEQRLMPIDQPENQLRQALNQLFPKQNHSDWQKVACAIAARRRFSIITGGPGTGKTTTVVRLLALLQAEALTKGELLRIRLAAPTGKAAARLTESISQQVQALPVSAEIKNAIPCEVSTLHRLLGSRPNTRHFKHHQDNPLSLDVLVIDEASMIDLDMMHSVLSALPLSAKLILLGDKDQLASVEAGAVLGDLCQNAEQGLYTAETLAWLEQVTEQKLVEIQPSTAGNALSQHIVMLRYSRRFGEDSGIGQLAKAVNTQDLHSIKVLWNQKFNDISQCSINDTTDAEFKTLVLNGLNESAQGYSYYLQELINTRPNRNETNWVVYEDWARHVLNAFDRFQLLCAVRKGAFGVEQLNQQISTWLHQHKLTDAADGWFEGRPVIITRNDYSLGLMNGDIGIALRVPYLQQGVVQQSSDPFKLRVVFPKNDGQGGLHFILPSRLSHFESVFAMTVHKSQGSEFAHTALILPNQKNPVLTKELVYTAITRAQTHFTLVESNKNVFKEAIKTQVNRLSGLKDIFSHKNAIH
ncbi:exodeoxyribonuclease V subunit alpha [Pseudomonas sp. F1_0610]|uniref:exodeoxyribonuclease V subunit alpha n=1 Tax=Pseudomonas sp. F1_0610 TaxID=3114284 RepID=UPI0039C11874